MFAVTLPKIAFVRIFAVACFIFSINTVFGQIKPEFFPEDVLTDNQEANCFCEPGVVNKSRSKGLSIAYTRFFGGQYDTESENGPEVGSSDLTSLNSFDFKLKVPLLLGEQTRILLGYDYFFEQYDFEQTAGDFSETVGTLNNRALKSTGPSAIVSHSLNEKNYLIFRYKFSANGNYEGFIEFDGDNSVHNVFGLFGIKKNENKEIGYGLLVSKNFRSTTVIPLFLYNHTFNANWGIETVLPANVFVRCNFDPLTLLVFGVEYNSRSFRVDVDETADPLGFAYNHSEIQASLELERHINSWVWANLKVGYQQNFGSEFETKNQFAPTFNADIQNGLFIQAGVFVSPTTKEEIEHKHFNPK